MSIVDWMGDSAPSWWETSPAQEDEPDAASLTSRTIYSRKGVAWASVRSWRSDTKRADLDDLKAAKELIEDELLQGAFKILEERYLQAWRIFTIDDVAARETLFKAINVVGKVRDHLGSVLSNGRLAERELRDLTETAARKKRFGIM